MKKGDLVSYAARDNQFVGMITGTKRYGTTLVRHQVEWTSPGIYRGIWHNEKNLELLGEKR
tara:strand:- start:2710 stop:2892 length:183 start_codon:yes stop_codon:yes gene_type:complete